MLEAKQMIKQIKKGKIKTFLQWMDQRKSKYYKIGWSYLQCHQDVEDVFQNTTLIVFQKIEQLKHEQYFETWVTSIFINECKSIYRKKSNQEMVPTNLAQDMKLEELRIEVFEALSHIEEKFKEVIILKYISDYSIEEISNILHIPEGTVKSRIFRGLRLLRKEME